jgi:hypothetical protein
MQLRALEDATWRHACRQAMMVCKKDRQACMRTVISLILIAAFWGEGWSCCCRSAAAARPEPCVVLIHDADAARACSLGLLLLALLLVAVLACSVARSWLRSAA